MRHEQTCGVGLLSSLTYTVSPLHTNLQVANSQRCERASGSSKESEPVPSTPGVSEIAACPPSPVADNPSALPSPTSSPSSSQYLFLPVPSMPAPVCQLLYCTAVHFKVLYCKIKHVFFIFRVCFLYYLCEKYYKPITVQHYLADYVSWVPRLTLLDLRTNWTYERTLRTELIRM